MSPDGSSSEPADSRGNVMIVRWPRQQYAYLLATLLATALLTATLSVWQVGVSTPHSALRATVGRPACVHLHEGLTTPAPQGVYAAIHQSDIDVTRA